MRVAEKAGLTKLFRKLLGPLTRLLFKGCDDSTMSDISMNITANMLGIANAATPLGISAVRKMKARGGRHMTRSIAMLTVLNTASIQLIPTTVGTMRAAHGSASPFEISLPILIVSLISASAGCLMVSVLSLRRRSYAGK